jgi:hypothetical protein
MEDEKRKETAAEQAERLRDHQLDAQIKAHGQRAEQNMRERMAKAKEQGESEEKSKTPYADELEQSMKYISQVAQSVDDMKQTIKKIKKSLTNIQPGQVQIAAALGDIWTFLIQSQVEIDKWFTYRGIDFNENIKQMKEDLEKENEDD